MKKLSIMLFALVAFSLASWASVTITPQMAVNIVKQQRTSAENLKADFYASAVTSFYTDGHKNVFSI